MVGLFGAVRKAWRSLVGTVGVPENGGRDGHAHNLFEAAAAYVTAYAEDDQERLDEAAGWVSPEALSFGVNELACRAVVALAREHRRPPQDVARALLGLPAAS